MGRGGALWADPSCGRPLGVCRRDRPLLSAGGVAVREGTIYQPVKGRSPVIGMSFAED